MFLRLTKIAILALFITTVQGVYLGVFYTLCEECVRGRYINRARGVCSNLCFAIASELQPGRLTIANTRAGDRGCRACRNQSPCGINCPLAANYKRTGNSCDEYPFASTLESGGHSGIPAVLRCVSRSENSSGGSQFQTFKSGKLPGDTFTVGIRYLPGRLIQFCIPSSRDNDGTEFRYFGGGLNNYHNARDLVVDDSKFVRAETANPNTTLIPSLYKTNHTDLFIAFTELDVGTPTYNEDHGWGEITEMVAMDAFAYDEEYQKLNPVVKREPDAC